MTSASHVGAKTGFGLLKRLAREHRRALAAACFCSALSAAFALGPPLALYGIAAVALGESPGGGIVWYALLALACVALHALLAAAANVIGHRAAFAIERRMRAELLDVIERAPLSVTEGRSGEIKKTFMADVERVESLLAHVLPDLAAGLTAPVVGAAMLFFVDWRMALAAVALLPVAYAAQLWTYRGRRADLMANWVKAEGEANAAMLSYVRGVATLKAFNRQASTLANVTQAVYALRDLAGAVTRGARYPYALFHAALSSNLLVILPVGLALRQSGAIGGAELALTLALGAGLTPPLLKAVFASMIAERTRASLDRVASLLNAPAIADGGNDRLGPSSAIRLEGVGYIAPNGAEILTDVSLDIHEGRVTAIVGPSGAGKTTLVRLLPRLDDATAGRILVGGVDCRSVQLNDLRDRIAFAAQDAMLFDGAVEENIRIARPGASEAEVAEAARKARAELINSGAGAGDRGRRLSGGERQRVAIGRAILKDAPILILDEATSFLDAESEAEVQAALSAAAAGRTLIVVAHRLSSIERADQIVVLDKGRVEAVGRHNELLRASPTYARMHAAQQAARGWRLGGFASTPSNAMADAP